MGILGKEDHVTLPLLAVGGGNNLLGVDVVVVAARVVILSAHLQVTAPQRPRKDKFGCPQLVAHHIGAGHRAAVPLLAHLVVELALAVLMEDVVGVEVNRGLAHLAIVIHIERVRHIGLGAHVDAVLQVVIKVTIGHHIGGEGAAGTVQEIGIGVILEACRVVVVENVVHARRGVNRVAVVLDARMLIHAPHGVGLHVKDKAVVLDVPVIVVPHATEHIESLVAVVPVQTQRQVGALAHVVTGLGVETEALALRALGLDEDD